MGAAVGVGIAMFAMASTGVGVAALPFMGKVMASLALGGISMEAGAIAEALTSNRGTNITLRQPAAFRQIVYGTQRVGGVLVYVSTTGSKHDQYNAIIVLAGHEIDSIENVYLDGRQVYFLGSGGGWSVRNGVGFGGVADNSDHVGPGGATYNFGGTGHSGVYFEARWGDQLPGDVITGLTANDPAWAPDGHGNSPYGGNCAYVYVKIEYNESLFPGGPAQSEIKFTVRGKNDIYDPRTGTKGYTFNSALVVADMITDTAFGLGDINSVNEDQLIAAANVCDEQVTLGIGGTESRFCGHVHYDAGLAPGDAMANMLLSMGGRLSRIGGEWYIWPAYWQGPNFDFDESILTGPPTWNPYRAFRELCNEVNGTFTAPNSPYNVAGNLYDANGWYNGTIANQFPFGFQPTSFPQYAQDVRHGYANNALLEEDSGVVGVWDGTTTYELDDAVTVSGVIYRSLIDSNTGNDPTTSTTDWVKWNNQLPMEMTLNCVLSVTQAQRLAKIALMRNRMQGSGVFPMHMAAWKMQPLSVYTFTFAPYKWSGKYLEITHTNFFYDDQDGSKVVRFEAQAQETAADIYEWDISEEQTIYDVPSNPAGLPFIIDPPTGLTLTSDATTALVGVDGVVTPRILASWTAPNDARIVQIQVQYELTGSGNWIAAPPVDVGTTSTFISGVLSGSTYDVRVRSLTNKGATSVWTETDGVTVSAPNSLQTTYTNNPAISLSQPTSTTIAVAATAVTFGSSTVNYAARTLTISAPSVPTWYYVTIADPTRAGESGSPTLTPTASTSTALVGVVGHTYMGAVLALPAGSAVSELAGGWPSPQTIQVG